jgi:hypothetical protein
MSGNANTAVTILPGRAWSGSVMASWTRVIQPTVLGNPDASYNNDAITGGADLAAQPNEGTLDWHFGYRFTGIFYEQTAGTPYNNTLHEGYTRGRWRFRPRTALIYEGTIATRHFSNSANAAFDEHTTTPIRAKFGLEGLITPRVSVMALVGYGGTFTTGANNDPSIQQYDSVIGTAEIRFFPTSERTELDSKPSLLLSTIALGYSRDFAPSYLGPEYGLDRGYLRAEYYFASRLMVNVEGSVSAYEHPDLYFATNLGAPTGQPVLMARSYTDVRAEARGFVEYRFLPSFGVNASVTYSENFSSTQLPVTEADAQKGLAGGGQYFDMSWRRITAFIGVRWLM